MSVNPFIEALRAQVDGVQRGCPLLEVSRAAYHSHWPRRRHAGVLTRC